MTSWTTRAALAAAVLLPLSCDSGGGGGGAAPRIILTGSQAREYLGDAPFPALHVEIDHVSGKAPDSGAQALLGTRLNERCNKPSGIAIQVSENNLPAGGNGKKWTLEEVRQVELQHRQTFDGTLPATKALYMQYLDGGFEADDQDSRVLGVAYSPSSICIFKDNITAAAPGRLGQFADDVEKAVIVHELGHMLGLVNNGVGMVAPHEDTTHPKHDTNTACVMYYAVEADLQAFLSGIPNQYDAACIADMQAAGGK
jgi:hypothetical protein